MNLETKLDEKFWEQVPNLLRAAWSVKRRPPTSVTICVDNVIYCVTADDYAAGWADVTVHVSLKGDNMDVQSTSSYQSAWRRIQIL